MVARTRNVIPRDRLVVKKGRYFSTDTSQKKLEAEIDEQEERKEVLAGYAPDATVAEQVEPPRRQTFTPKNGSGK